MTALLSRIVLAAALAAAAAGPVRAVQPDEILPDPALERRAREISAELRCMVCQNQSIDDSDAPLAKDLRVLVRDRLKAGDSNEAVKEFLVDRYGQFVLLKPRFEWETAVLWLTPFVVLGLGALAVVTASRRRRPAQGADAVLSEDERKRLDDLLSGS
ncbi:cytochrome c-type biogenesis protein [Prosthecomicrobium sp. N25]|uniref:cytochrome c-type biogenesis protein n=1 Tax=Prosthecomicrobium sp. N25 TaxID=3129254 RepID=UPI003077BAC7